MEILFWVSVFLIGYTYLVYPAIMLIWGTYFAKRVGKRYVQVPASIVIAARNEETNIEQRIRNVLLQDYPPDMLEVIIVSDRSTDRTVEKARGIGDPRVRVFELEAGEGKAMALNVGVHHATHDIIVFADARQRFTDNTVAELVAMFQDNTVGAVSGELKIMSGDSEVGEGVGLYWEYEKLIRRMESEVHATVGATGSIYAIRRELFVPLPPGTLLDDFLVPMRIVLQGFRVVFVRSARAFDFASERGSHEFARKVRTLAGNFQAFAFERALLSPRKNPVFFQMFSHKIMRLFVPYFLIAAFVSNLYLRGPIYLGLMALQIAFYSSILLRLTPLKNTRFGVVTRIAWTFVVMNAAAVVGFWVYLRGRERGVWDKPPERAAAPQALPLGDAEEAQSPSSDSRNRSVKSTP